jgi:hypothetical protein
MRRLRARHAVRHGIPRFVDVPEDATARRTQESFGYEWTHFTTGGRRQALQHHRPSVLGWIADGIKPV